MDLAEAKEKHGASYQITAFDGDGNEVIGFLKKPSRVVIGALMSKASTDPLGANEILLKNCLIKEISDNRILTDDDAFMSACMCLDEVITIKKAELKKN